MTKKIHFHKMQGSGNDYIYIDAIKHPITDPEEKARRWSKYHTGIGSDGLVLIEESDIADFSMRIFNADGSEAKMCGNASRCIGKYVYEQGLTNKTKITLETLSGIKELKLQVDNNLVKTITVDMGIPEISDRTTQVTVAGKTYEGTVISMGNPHYVILVEDLEKMDISTIGPLIEKKSLFPERTNVEFVEIEDKQNIRMRVWERGSGITMACGTGACASLAACVKHGKTAKEANVKMDGGTLSVLWDENNHIQMAGDAVTVFEGKIE